MPGRKEDPQFVDPPIDLSKIKTIGHWHVARSEALKKIQRKRRNIDDFPEVDFNMLIAHTRTLLPDRNRRRIILTAKIPSLIKGKSNPELELLRLQAALLEDISGAQTIKFNSAGETTGEIEVELTLRSQDIRASSGFHGIPRVIISLPDSPLLTPAENNVNSDENRRLGLPYIDPTLVFLGSYIHNIRLAADDRPYSYAPSRNPDKIQIAIMEVLPGRRTHTLDQPLSPRRP